MVKWDKIYKKTIKKGFYGLHFRWRQAYIWTLLYYLSILVELLAYCAKCRSQIGNSQILKSVKLLYGDNLLPHCLRADNLDLIDRENFISEVLWQYSRGCSGTLSFLFSLPSLSKDFTDKSSISVCEDIAGVNNALVDICGYCENYSVPEELMLGKEQYNCEMKWIFAYFEDSL